MCLLFVYQNPEPKEGEYKIVLVNNRDETYTRPSKPAHFWDKHPNIIGGMDMEIGREGGTWLAMNKTGKIACLLNILQPKNEFIEKKTFSGRGFLVVDYLVENISSSEYIKKTTDSGLLYNDFNYITLEPISDKYNIHYYSNTNNIIEKKTPGVHGFGNCLPTYKWNKVLKGENKMSEIIEAFGTIKNEDKLVDALFRMMANKESTWPDKLIADQGRGYEDSFLEPISSICVENPKVDYGTRTTTIILVEWSGRVLYKERNMEGIVHQNDLPLQSEDREAEKPGLVDISNVNWNEQKFEFFLEK